MLAGQGADEDLHHVVFVKGVREKLKRREKLFCWWKVGTGFFKLETLASEKKKKKSRFELRIRQISFVYDYGDSVYCFGGKTRRTKNDEHTKPDKIPKNTFTHPQHSSSIISGGSAICCCGD